MHNRPARILVVVAAAAVLAVAGIAVNFLLLRYADSSNDPVGTLTPRASITQPSSPPTTQAASGTGDHGNGEERDD
jgi:hypothetical protein